MKSKKILEIFSIIFTLFILNFVFAVTGNAVNVDADYITIYSGEQKNIKIDVENNENFDIEDVSIKLVLDDIPFTTIGSSEKEIDEIEEDKDESVTFTIKTSTDITPGDYNLPYIITFTNAEDENETYEKSGNFGIRVSAKTEIDFAVEARGETTEHGIVGERGRISLEVINKGFGNLKAVNVEIFPQGFELLSKESVYLGTINADDSDTVSFDVVFRSIEPKLSAKIDFKDFDNKEQLMTIEKPLKVYSKEQALELGLIQENKTQFYIGVVIVVIIIWIIFRKISKFRKKKRNNRG